MKKNELSRPQGIFPPPLPFWFFATPLKSSSSTAEISAVCIVVSRLGFSSPTNGSICSVFLFSFFVFLPLPLSASGPRRRARHTHTHTRRWFFAMLPPQPSSRDADHNESPQSRKRNPGGEGASDEDRETPRRGHCHSFVLPWFAPGVCYGHSVDL